MCTLSIALFKNVSSVMSSKIGDSVTAANRPRVRVQIGDTTMSWLYDTGAAKSCISTEQFHSLFPNGYENFPASKHALAGLKDAGRNSLNLYGIIPLNLTILGKTIKH